MSLGVSLIMSTHEFYIIVNVLWNLYHTFVELYLPHIDLDLIEQQNSVKCPTSQSNPSAIYGSGTQTLLDYVFILMISAQTT